MKSIGTLVITMSVREVQLARSVEAWTVFVLPRLRYLPKSLWRCVPRELVVRVLRVQAHIPGFRTQNVTLVTTLSDHTIYPASELAGLYLRRWHIELWWRQLKTSMGMEVLRCHSPAMIRKELEMYLTAYNLIRGV